MSSGKPFWSTPCVSTLASILLLLATSTAPAAERIAYVLGVDAYQDEALPDLLMARGDAEQVAARLGELGFDVESALDVDRERALASLREFVSRHANADLPGEGRSGIAIFYYAGHGVEYQGDAGPQGNYLLLANSESAKVPQTALPLDLVIAELNRLPRHHIVLVLDACRDVRTRALVPMQMQPSLGRVSRLPKDSSILIQYATAFDEKTLDVGRRGHSPFTGELLQHLGTPGLTLQETLAMTMSAAQAGYGLTPFQEGTLSGVVVLRKAPWWSRGEWSLLLLTLVILAFGSLFWMHRRTGLLRVVQVMEADSQRLRAQLRPGDEVLIGRDPEAQIWLEHPSISARHARLVFDGQTLWIEDLGSTGGTFVDGAWQQGADVHREPLNPLALPASSRRALHDGECIWLSERAVSLQVRWAHVRTLRVTRAGTR